MKLTREELANLLGVSSKYLCPSNFSHVKNGAKEKGYNLISMEGKGQSAIFELEPLENLSLPNEIWKDFPLAPGYQVSNLGRVKHPKGGILQGTDDYGYVRVQVKGMGQQAVHRMVMLTFKPIENANCFSVDHINGKRKDNRLENLRWVFQTENMRFQDENNTEIKEIIAKLVQKYGYDETKNKLSSLL